MKKTLLFLLLAPFGLSAQDFWSEVVPFGDISTYYPEEISIVDDQVVWVRGLPNVGPAYSQFSISLDAGQTWSSGDINLGSNDIGIATLHAVSATRAYVAAFPTEQTTTTGGIWMTDNAGSTWTQQPTAFSSGTSFANLIHFFDLNNGVAVGDPQNGDFEIYTTTNGGINWTQVVATNIPDANMGEYGYTQVFESRGNNLWFGTNQGSLYHSSDMGLHWVKIQTPVTDFGNIDQGACFAFKDSSDGLLITRDFSQYDTNNGGVFWAQDFSMTGAPRNFRTLYVPGTSNAYFSWGEEAGTGARGSSYSTDGGNFWHNLSEEEENPVYPLSAEFQSGTTGFCIGYYESEPGVIRFFRLTDPLNRLLKKETFIAEKAFVAAPNPTTDTIKLSGAEITSVDVYDISGKLLFSTPYNGEKEVMLDFSKLQAGAYFAKANGDGNASTIKIIKN